MIILTPGPVTTSPATKAAMLRDYSPNEPELLALTAELRRTLVELANGGEDYVCVPLQGTGNTANEATLGTLAPRDRKLLIVNNGHYGARLVEIAEGIGVPFAVLELPITEPVGAAQLEAALAADAAVSHVVVCHVDTGTGLLNPIEPLAEVAQRRKVGLIVDAIASFGGLPLDARALRADAIVLSPNKWLEGLPGIALVLVKRSVIEAAQGRCHSYCLDLYRQWRNYEDAGRWRFTPPAQSIAALAAALRQHAAEGREARLLRVQGNWRTLVLGLRALGFQTVLEDAAAAPVIATFHEPADPSWDRERFFACMRDRGFVTFRGRLTPFPSLRIGCMGAFDQATMREVVAAVEAALATMGVSDCQPATRPEAAE